MRDYVTVAFDTLFKSTVMPIFKADIQARYSRPIEKSDIFIQGRFKNIPPKYLALIGSEDALSTDIAVRVLVSGVSSISEDDSKLMLVWKTGKGKIF